MRARSVGASLVVALPLSVVLVGCILPGALAVADRLPRCDRQIVSAGDLPGSYESVEICGDIASCVRRISYCFEGGGTYTGEAVLVFESGPASRQIAGTWKLVSGMLDLGHGSEPAEIHMDGDRLRLTTSLGMVVLQRTR